ncbi:MAG: NUDIX domain-containing protein [Candidatus Moraniibacteriota bacterium]
MEQFKENRIEKPVRHAVSIVIKNANGETLFALRSPHKDSYPSTWSLPSHYVSEDEELAETVRRIGEKKLGVTLEPVSLLMKGSQIEEISLFLCMIMKQELWRANHALFPMIIQNSGGQSHIHTSSQWK